MLEGKDRAAATLDYTKFFDRFDPDFYMKMLKEMGYPGGLADMQIDMYKEFIRHIKIAGTYGEPVQSECGMGQGCCLSLIAANATVAIEFLMLQEKAPEVEKSAFIDDRTLDAEKVQQLEVAIKEVVKMDQMMGHSTNVDKSKVLATTRRTRKQAGQMEIGGLKLNLVNDFKLLGHRCTAAHRFVIQDADEAALEARIRVNRVATLPLDYENKLNILKTSPLKVFVAATQWGRAKVASISILTSEVLRVVWGKTRKLRAKEVVLGLLHEATDYHPRSAMIWSSIANARRMMMKDDKILQQAKETCEMIQEREQKALKQRLKAIEKEAEGRKDRLDSAKAESNRSNQPDAEECTRARKADQPSTIPTKRLSKKTSEDKVRKQNTKEKEESKQVETKEDTREENARATCPENKEVTEEDKERLKAVEEEAAGRKDRRDSAKAESNRPNQPDAEDHSMARKADQPTTIPTKRLSKKTSEEEVRKQNRKKKEGSKDQEEQQVDTKENTRKENARTNCFENKEAKDETKEWLKGSQLDSAKAESNREPRQMAATTEGSHRHPGFSVGSAGTLARELVDPKDSCTLARKTNHHPTVPMRRTNTKTSEEKGDETESKRGGRKRQEKARQRERRKRQPRGNYKSGGGTVRANQSGRKERSS